LKTNNNISFDELIKNTFDGAQSLPPAGVWESVASQVGVSSGAAIATTSFIKTIVGKVLVGSIVVVLTTVGIVKMVDSTSTEKIENKEAFEAQKKEQSIQSEDVLISNENQHADNSNTTSGKVDADKDKTDLTSKTNPSEPINISGQSKVTTNAASSIQEGPGAKPIRVLTNNSIENGMLITVIDSVYCTGEPIQLQAYYLPIWEEIVKVNSGATLLNGTDNNWVLSYAKPGKYQVALIGTKNGAKYSVTKNLYIEELKADFNVKQTKNGVTLSANTTSGVNYKWSINKTEYKNTRTATLYIPYADFNNAAEADIQLEIRKGNCTDTRTNKIILPKEEKELFIPNVFTPTVEDGKNDCFKIVIEETIFYYLVIKNRNGNIVFESQNSEECWNGAINNKGEKCAPDAYFYQLIYQKENREKKTLTGRVQLF
jgi:gliding motility-associated-like protein